jgi:predicted glycosyltransferase
VNINQEENALKKVKKIWIDLENSPHVLFFNPIIKMLKERGFSVVITARDYAQVYALADLFKIDYIRIGRHFGKNKMNKMFGLITRMLQLYLSISKEKPKLALNHYSRSQLLATKLLGIKCITAIDYEYTQRIPFVKPTLTIMPQVLYNNFERGGLNRIRGYPGIKEDVYVQSYIPDKSVLNSLGIQNGCAIVTIRPPATEAHYHNTKSDDFFKTIVDFICNKNEAYTIIVPRTKKQDAYIREMWPALITKGKILIPDQAVNGLDLIWYSDLVISGGGTMIREAAALNVPAYSFFQGKTGAVDQYLSEIGKLTLLENIEDVYTKIKLTPRVRPDTPEDTGRAALESIIEIVDSMINS